MEKAVEGKEPRLVLMLSSTSVDLNPDVLYKAVNCLFTSNKPGDFLLSLLEEPGETEADLPFWPRAGKAASALLLSEVKGRLQLLLQQEALQSGSENF